MMASSSSSSNLTDQLLQDELPWPSSSLPFASVLHSVNHHWSQPLMLNSADELQLLLSAQGHHHIHQDASPVIPPQLISPSMMQDLGFQWSNCGSADSTAMLFMSGELQQDGHNMIKEEQRRESSLNSRSSCAAAGSTAAIAYNDILGGCSGLPAMAAADDLNAGIVLPSINISRPLQKLCPPPPPLPGDAFEILASSRLCKTLLLGQASSVLLHNGMPLLRSEHVPYGPPPPEAAAVHPHQGPRIDNYKMAVVNAMGGGRHWGAETNAAAACHQKTTVPSSSSSSPAPSPKKPRLESQSSNAVVPSFKVRKEKLGDRIAALQQLVCPFGKTDTASVLMEAIGYINFLQDQVKTLSGPYLRSSRTNKPKTKKRGSPNGNGEEQEETRLDLRSRGLCLVPLSCTSYVTNENGVWAPPNFSGN